MEPGWDCALWLWPGFESWPVPLAACSEWVPNALGWFFLHDAYFGPCSGGPNTWMKQYMLSVSRAVKSCIHVGLFLWVLLCVCVHVYVHACVCACGTQHHCPLPPEGTRRQYLKLWFCLKPGTE